MNKSKKNEKDIKILKGILTRISDTILPGCFEGIRLYDKAGNYPEILQSEGCRIVDATSSPIYSTELRFYTPQEKNFTQKADEQICSVKLLVGFKKYDSKTNRNLSFPIFDELMLAKGASIIFNEKNCHLYLWDNMAINFEMLDDNLFRFTVGSPKMAKEWKEDYPGEYRDLEYGEDDDPDLRRWLYDFEDVW